MEAAAIFDWDGVVVDSSGYHRRSWERLARQEGRGLPEGYFEESFGMRNEAIIPDVLGWSREAGQVRRLSARKEELYRRIIAEEGIRPLPGAQDLLEGLRRRGVPRAVGSSTERANINCALSAMGMEGRFETIVAGEDVRRGKPHPEVFTRAAALLGARPERCVVFEDAPVGIEAAGAAGMKVIGVATTHPAETLRGADLVVSGLEEVSAGDVARLAGGRPGD